MITPTPRRAVAGLALAFGALLLAGCVPSRFTIDLAPGDAELEETPVLTDPDAPARRAPKVALIDVEGVIRHAAAGGLLGRGGNIVDATVARLDKAAEDDQVRAVVLRINSPGGTVAASESLYAEIAGFRARTGKPVVVSMAEVAASGGYYIALAADELVAQPGSVTGSVGVIIQTFNFSAGMERWGIAGRSVTSRPNKAIANPFEPESEAHYAILQSMVDDFYAEFRGRVAERRPGAAADAQSFDRLTDGRVLTGSQALEAGLVDATGTLRDAFESAKRLAGVESARLVKYHAEGRAPRSPYGASAPVAAPTLGAGPTTVNLLNLSLGSDPGVSSPVFYYLWAPALP